MKTIEVMGHEFEVNITKEFCEQGAKKAEQLQKKLNQVKGDNIDAESLDKTIYESGKACRDFMVWAFGKDSIKKAFGDEIEILELFKIAEIACEKLTALMPKPGNINTKIKI